MDLNELGRWVLLPENGIYLGSDLNFGSRWGWMTFGRRAGTEGLRLACSLDRRVIRDPRPAQAQFTYMYT